MPADIRATGSGARRLWYGSQILGALIGAVAPLLIIRAFRRAQPKESP